MDRTSSPKLSPAVLPFPADHHHKRSLYPSSYKQPLLPNPLSIKTIDEIDAVEDSGDGLFD